MHVAVEEEITNNHGRLKRFIPEAQIQDKVCIIINLFLLFYCLRSRPVDPDVVRQCVSV